MCSGLKVIKIVNSQINLIFLGAFHLKLTVDRIFHMLLKDK